jgi:16S rRNA (guanine527-N7)-methyltransferase
VTPYEALSSGAERILGRALSEQERADFDNYLKLLLQWQKAHRLVGSSDPMWIVEHLFLDSLIFLRVLPASVHLLADVGSGAGLPGLPIKIVKRDLQVVLIESRRRRAMFLTNVVRALGLGGARVLEGRVESLLPELQGRMDAVVMRCAGNIGDMIPAVAPLVSASGMVVASGPPQPRPLSLGKWITVPGIKPGATRRFAVYKGSTA